MNEELTYEEKRFIYDSLLRIARMIDDADSRGNIDGRNNSDKVRRLAFKVERMIGQKNEQNTRRI